MKAIIAPDATRTPGVAVICVYDAPGAGPADVAIYSGDGKYLSASGWQESRVSLPVDAHDDDSGCLRLQVGAAVVDNLDKLERYLFMAGDQKCVLQIKDLVYSRMQGGDGMGHAASPAAAPASQPMLLPDPEPEPAPMPAPAPDPEPEAEPSPLLAGEPLEMDQPAAETAKEKKSSGSLLWIILGLVLLALAAAAVWWFFLRATPPPPPPMAPQTPATRQEAAAPAEAPQEKPPVQNPVPVEPPAPALPPDTPIAVCAPMPESSAVPKEAPVPSERQRRRYTPGQSGPKPDQPSSRIRSTMGRHTL